jgi:hypothetical protein
MTHVQMLQTVGAQSFRSDDADGFERVIYREDEPGQFLQGEPVVIQVDAYNKLLADAQTDRVGAEIVSLFWQAVPDEMDTPQDPRDAIEITLQYLQTLVRGDMARRGGEYEEDI